MKKLHIMAIALVGALTFAVGLLGCQEGYRSSGSATKSTAGSATKEQMPPAEGEAFWTYITQTNPYTQWGTWPGYEDIYPGKSPHGAYLRLYANGIALNAVREGKETMPDGAILVKENYGDDQETLMAVTPMYKIEGFNPEGGDWFWGKYGPDGKIMASGKVEGCIKCHGAVKANDWIFTEAK
jgi:hypothetical protein